MNEPTPSLAADRQKIGPLLGAVALVAAPHAQNLSSAVMAYFGLLLLWRAGMLYFKLRPPGKPVLLLLTLAGAGIVLGHYHRFWGQEAGSSLFIAGLGLKLLELKTLRDAYLVVFLAFFVALTQYLFSQSIPMAAYTLAVVVLLVTAMIGLNSDESFPAKARLKLALGMVAQALPLMLLLFVFFPRIQTPMWHFPEDGLRAKTGLSDTLSPGSFSQLSLSQEMAFRVDFEGEPPPARLLYWRGPVFWHTDGVKWDLLPALAMPANGKPYFSGGFHSYTITLEPHGQRWAYALDLPNSIPAGFRQSTDHELWSRHEITERRQYRLSSGTSYSTGPLSASDARKGLQLPDQVSPRLKTLVESWQAENPDPRAVAERALRYFREEKFYYTLTPPPTQGDPVEGFLLDTRRGYCEHYATAFVMLMRLAGIPARIVTGYQGGQWNSLGHFLEVKQADAHSWAEVWLEGSGWTRIDPTAAVAPERIERGLDVDKQVADGEIRFNLGDRLSGKGTWATLWRRARMLGASIDHAWDSWVLAYGAENQTRLFQWLGWVDWRSLAGGLAAALALLFGLLAWLLLPKRRPVSDPAKRHYEHFLEKLARRGLRQRIGEGAHDFAARVAEAAPELAEGTARITGLYLKLRYGRGHGPAELKILRRLVKAFPSRPKAGGWAG